MTATKIAIALSLAAFFLYRLVFWWLHPLYCWPDQTVYLAMGQLVLQGKVPYADFFDFNTPVIIYLSTLPCLLASICNWPSTFAFIIAVYALTAASLALVWLIFENNKQQSLYRYRWLIIFALLAFTQMQKNDFGQREHIFVLLFLPYVILRCVNFSSGGMSRFSSCLIGAMAGLAVCIKPLFIEVPLIFELAWQVRSRNVKALFDWECRCLLLAIFVCAGLFFLLPKDALDVFFNQALPIYSCGFAAFSNSVIFGLDGDAAFSWPVYFMVATLIFSVVLNARSKWLLPLSALVLGGFAIYLQSCLVWTYRMMPLVAFSVLLFSVQIGIVSDIFLARVSGAAKKIIGGFTAFIFLTVVSVYSLVQARSYIDEVKGLDYFSLSVLGYSGRCPERDFDAVFYSILKNSATEDSVLVISPTVLPCYPAVLQSGRTFAGRYMHGMILPMLHFCAQNHPGDKSYTRLEKEVIQNYGQDIVTKKPRLVFITSEFIRPQLDSYNFVQTYLKDYQSLGLLHQFPCEVFRRKDNTLLSAKSGRLRGLSLAARRELVLKILNHSIGPAEAAATTGLSDAQIEDWIRRAQDALDQALTDNAGGGEAELRARVIDGLRREGALREEIAKLKKQLDDTNTGAKP